MPRRPPISTLSSSSAASDVYKRQSGEIAVLGKGKKLRVVFLSKEAREYLIQYLISRGAMRKEETDEDSNRNSKFVILNSVENEPLFISNRNARLNARAIERMISKYAKTAGISKQVT